MNSEKNLRPFGMRDKIGYAFGDFGCNMSFAFINSYLMIFYVTCMKIKPEHFAVLILLGKIFDAVNDPIIGSLCDASKPGKSGSIRTGAERRQRAVNPERIIKTEKEAGIQRNFLRILPLLTYRSEKVIRRLFPACS